MNFGQAIESVKLGHRMRRAGWNGKGMFIFLGYGTKPPLHGSKDGLIYGVSTTLFSQGSVGSKVEMPHLVMRAASGERVVGWLASQTDILAEDWEPAP